MAIEQNRDSHTFEEVSAANRLLVKLPVSNPDLSVLKGIVKSQYQADCEANPNQILEFDNLAILPQHKEGVLVPIGISSYEKAKAGEAMLSHARGSRKERALLLRLQRSENPFRHAIGKLIGDHKIDINRISVVATDGVREGKGGDSVYIKAPTFVVLKQDILDSDGRTPRLTCYIFLVDQERYGEYPFEEKMPPASS